MSGPTGSTSVKRQVASLGVAIGCAVVAGLALWHATAPRTIDYPIIAPSESGAAMEHLPFGPIRPPRALPQVALVMDDGERTTLAAALEGRWTMLQLMFTGCSTTCPIQGTIFTRAQSLITADAGPVALLSISVDPIGDTPAAMKSWLQTYEADPRWRGAVPDSQDLPALVDALNGRGDSIDVHDARVYFIDPDGRLVYATHDMPDPEALARLMADALAGPPGN